MHGIQRLKWIIKKLKASKVASNRIIVCPRCGSTHIRLSSSMDVWLTPRVYVCSDCGYIGPVCLEVEKEKR